MDSDRLLRIYCALESRFGGGTWWPHETVFEVMVGAILTQQTQWNNVEMALHNLKKEGLMEPRALARAPTGEIENCVRPSGFFRQKTARVQHLARYLVDNYQGEPDRLFERDINEVRNELLSLPGIGPETTDSILLFAGNKPKFVIDAYTLRIFSRLGTDFEGQYERAQKFFETNLPNDTGLFRNFHAYLVELAKSHCRTAPQCRECPINEYCGYFAKSG